MAALTDNIEIVEKGAEKVAHPVVASDIIYRGALVKHNAAGYLAPCASEAGAKFAGVAYEKVDNSSGAAGAVNCKVIKKGRFLLTGSSFAQADVGEKVYASDDQTITKTYAAGLQWVGVIDEYVSATQVYVKIDMAVDIDDDILGEEIALADGKMFVGNAAGKAEQQTLSHRVVFAGSHTTAGGDAAEVITVTGALATDLAFVQLHTEGASPVTVDAAAAATDAINVTMSADPSTDHVLKYMVLRAV